MGSTAIIPPGPDKDATIPESGPSKRVVACPDFVCPAPATELVAMMPVPSTQLPTAAQSPSLAREDTAVPKQEQAITLLTFYSEGVHATVAPNLL